MALLKSVGGAKWSSRPRGSGMKGLRGSEMVLKPYCNGSETVVQSITWEFPKWGGISDQQNEVEDRGHGRYTERVEIKTPLERAMGITNNPLLSDADRQVINSGIIDRIKSIIRDEASQLISHMTKLGMTAEYKITVLFDVVELHLYVKYEDQKLQASTGFSAASISARSQCVFLVRQELESLIHRLFFEQPLTSRESVHHER